MPIYKLAKDKFHTGEDGERLKVGDTIEMSEERFKNANLKDRFELVAGSSEGDEVIVPASFTRTESQESKFSAISQMTLDEVKNLIESLDTEEDLELLRKEELANKNRKGVISAIDAALED